MGVQGSRGCCFYSPGLGLGVRATLERRALHPDSGRVRVLPEVGDDERVPRVGEREERKRGVTGWAEGKGKRAGGGGFWAAGNEKRERESDGLGWKGSRGKEKVFHFQKRIQALSKQIQTQRFEFKLNNKQIKMQTSMRCTHLFSLYLFYG